MLAYFRQKGLSSAGGADELGRRLALSLGLFHGKPAAWVADGSSIFIECDVRRLGEYGRRSVASQRARQLSLVRSPGGATALISGEIDNLQELSEQLGVPNVSAVSVYLAALDRWGDRADLHCIGDYCSLVVLPDDRVRLARSPWRGPPLHYFHKDGMTVVSSVPRVLLAAGVPAELDQQKLVDNLYCNLTEDRGWYRDTNYVDIGQVVWLAPGERRKATYYYDHLASRETPFVSRERCIEDIDQLLRESCRRLMSNARQPGIFLSGGLDSTNVAMRAVDYLPAGTRLKSFTFRPHRDFVEPEGDNFGDEWPYVEELAARQPLLEPYAVHGQTFDEDWDRLILAMGQAPVSLPNVSIYSPICALAGRERCDLMLHADFGNFTFSNSAPWAFSEFLRRGKWGELMAAVSKRSGAGKPFLSQFMKLAVNPMLPDWMWWAWRKAQRKNVKSQNELIGGLRQSAIQACDARARAAAANTYYLRGTFATREQFTRWVLGRGDMHVGDIMQAYEQIHGFRWRDVTSYRPLVEYCLGLPTEAFIHKGTSRWLARELGRGLLPESIRTNPGYGRQNEDWYERITPRLGEITRELESMERDEVLSAILDLDRLRTAVKNWPEKATLDPTQLMALGMAVPRALMTARLYRSVYRRNDT